MIVGSTITVNLKGQYIVSISSLLSDAALITVSETLISLAPSVTALIVKTSTVVLVSALTSTVTQSLQSVILSVLTLAESAVTVNIMFNYIVTEQILSVRASAITVFSTLISLVTSTLNLVIDMSTELVTVTLSLKLTNKLSAVDSTGRGLLLQPMLILQLWLRLLSIILFQTVF